MVFFGLKFVLPLSAVFVLFSCSRSPVKTTSEVVKPSPIVAKKAPEPIRLPSKIRTEFDDNNVHVQKWVKYFTGRGKKAMKRYLKRSGRYVPLMKEILAEYQLPQELVYVAMIESGFSSRAVSTASAVGYWQFIRGTGKRYGLEISHHVDERRDPVLATHAAAKYLKALYTVFGSWHLALSSYNAGENRVKRSVMNHYNRDYWSLVEKKALPRETRNYVGKFLAALRISQDPEAYGFQSVDYEDPIQFTEISANHSVNLRKMAQKMGLSLRKLKKYNPKYKYDLAPARKGQVVLRVPAGWQRSGRIAMRESKWNAGGFIGESYIVRRGDTLSGIARKTGTSMRNLKAWNSIGRRGMIRIGQKLRISKTQKSLKKSVLRTARKTKSRSAFQPKKIHIVRQGETLSAIARKYSVSLTQLTAANRIRNRSRIFIGSQLVIPD